MTAGARFVGMLLTFSLAPVAGATATWAMEPGQSSQPVAEIGSTVSLPMFLDAARLPDLQEAWRARFGDGGEFAAAAVARSDTDAGTATIVEAREVLTRAEKVNREAEAVRDRAEELSRRFAGDPDGGSTPVPDPSPAPVTPDDATVTETAAAAPTAATDGEDGSAGGAVETVAATASVKADAVIESAPAAPVIEQMATKPERVARNYAPPMRAGLQPASAPEPPTFFGSLFVGDQTGPQPDPHPAIPTELRSFGWNSQP